MRPPHGQLGTANNAYTSNNTQLTSSRRQRLYRWAVGLSVVYLLDGAFMTWALLYGGFAWLGYVKVSYFPIFLPALAIGMVVSGWYIHGFLRRGWVARKAEWLFFFILTDAVIAKIVIIIDAKWKH